MLSESVSQYRGANSKPARRKFEQLSSLHQQIIEDYWRRRRSDEDIADWARQLLSRKISKDTTLIRIPLASISIDPSDAVQALPQTDTNIVDFSPLSRQDPAKRAWLKCLDHAEVELQTFDASPGEFSCMDLAARRERQSSQMCTDLTINFAVVDDANSKVEYNDGSIDQLCFSLINNLMMLVSNAIDECVDDGKNAFVAENVMAAHYAAAKLDKLQRLQAELGSLVQAWQKNLPLPCCELSGLLPEDVLPGIQDAYNYLGLQVKQIDDEIKVALEARDFEVTARIAQSASKLCRLQNAIGPLVGHLA